MTQRPKFKVQGPRPQVWKRGVLVATALLILCFGAGVFAAAVPAAWNHWQYFRPVDPVSSGQRLAAIELPVGVLLRAKAQLADVRLISGEGSEVPIVVQAEWEADPLAVAARVSRQKSTASQTIWRADTGSRSAPISEMRFQTVRGEFKRQLQIATSDDGERWGVLAVREIYRIESDGQRSESLRAVFPETCAQFWRVTVFDDNNPPLDDLFVGLYATPRRLVFRVQPATRYLLLYGNPVASPPRYELARLLSRRAISEAPVARLGAEELNASYQDPRPWSERHPIVLWVALAVAIAVLGLLSLRALASRPA